MTEEPGKLALMEIGTPGPMRDFLVGRVLEGRKIATTGLEIDWEMEGVPISHVGERQLLVDSDEKPIAEIEITGLQRIKLGEITDQIARDEGEDFASAAEYRVAHDEFWLEFADEYREFTGDPDWAVTDETPVVVQYLRVVRLIPGS